MKLGKRSYVSAGQLGAVLAAGALGVSLGCGKKATDETVATVNTKRCVSGFERVDLIGRTSTLLMDRTEATEKGNGNVIGAKNGKFYAALAASDGAGGYKSQIHQFDVKAGTTKKFYEISDANYASYALGYDSAANKLLVGEKIDDGTGKFSIFDLATDSVAPASTLPLPLPPSKLSIVTSGMAIAAVSADYTSSKLFFQNTSVGSPTGELRTLLDGESGDPWTSVLNNTLYFFNRTTTSSNFRTLDPTQPDGAPTTQIRTEGVGLGDPHDALWLSADRVLLAHYTAGKLIVINPIDGSVKQEIKAEWDLGSDTLAVFRPEALYRAANATTGEIYVVNQGRNSDFSGFTGAQQLFILKDDGSNLTVVDLDATKAKVQGIKLNVANPQIIDGTDDPNKPIVGGFCTIYDKATP